jgi:hypothetical protein
MRVGTLESLEPRRHFASGNILFIAGATRSGGFLEASTPAARDAQLASIHDTSTAAGNSGWGTSANELRSAGFSVSQMTEPKEKVEDGSGFTRGRPVRFELMDLSQYAAIVFGSNNARYEEVQINAIDNYIRGGGSALFISDANFGSNWRDAADSDQAFLSRYFITVNQDAAQPTSVSSRAGGQFADAEHPILSGVNAISGEGVSALTVPVFIPIEMTITRVIGASGKVRNNDGRDAGNKFQGTLRDATVNDAALVTVNVGAGRVIGYFDRNTFFNAGGLGTDITENDNRRLALNMFEWLTDKTRPSMVSSTFTAGAPHELKITFDDRILGLSRSDLLLRDPVTAEPLPRTRWGWALDEVGGRSVLTIRVKAATPAGMYQLQINRNKFVDDGGNANTERVRVNFTIG